MVLINPFILLLIGIMFSADAYSATLSKNTGNTDKGFTSSEEYLAHTKSNDTCTTKKCHAELSGREKKKPHDPVAGGKCSACHKADKYPDKYGVDTDQRKACTVCHKKLAKKIKESAFIHGPIQDGDCVSCHDPHGSDRPFLLRQSYTELCSLCHNLKRLFIGEVLHQPVKDGNCGLCHDPHASNNKSRLTDTGANLCVICHDDMVSGMSEDHVHAPIIKSGCTECHDPHAGKDTLRLKLSAETICFSCHTEKKNEVSQYTYKHKPAFEGQCIACHSPHFSKQRFLLRDKVDTLCYNCHKENRIWQKKLFQHGPVAQGNCTACHNPHGSDNAAILKMAFPEKFYTEYEKGKYDLCFLCHKEALVTSEKDERVTYFRNGEDNIHKLHVNQKKGRSCRACHDVHASDLENHLREEFKYGKMSLPVSYTKTETGGSCTPGCHKERRYDREKKIQYEDR